MMTTENKSTEMTKEESLALIAQVMKRTQKEVGKNTGMPFIIWGGVTTLVSIVVWVVSLYVKSPAVNFLWLLIPVLGGVISAVTKKLNPASCRNELHALISRLWLVNGLTVLVLSFAPVMYSQLTGAWPMHYNILFVIALLLSFGTTMTGIVVRESMTVISGVFGLVMVLLFPIFTFYLPSLQVLYFGSIFFATMCVPGVFLNRINAHADV